MFTQGLLENFANNRVFKLVVVYSNKIKGYDFEEEHSHKEVYTLIPHQILSSVAENAWWEIYV